ncbi:hypothetical protein E2C01_092220 [Portunus trituberculatus]|uniref:Uncharacterized protein n=1 Tax=Portunus trituberculatus TaxID=210409 RepID=A0A5B7JV81_PORTR|nr:hypothetical protein [Portunus trituberculatus]
MLHLGLAGAIPRYDNAEVPVSGHQVNFLTLERSLVWGMRRVFAMALVLLCDIKLLPRYLVVSIIREVCRGCDTDESRGVECGLVVSQMLWEVGSSRPVTVLHD